MGEIPVGVKSRLVKFPGNFASFPSGVFLPDRQMPEWNLVKAAVVGATQVANFLSVTLGVARWVVLNIFPSGL